VAPWTPAERDVRHVLLVASGAPLLHRSAPSLDSSFGRRHFGEDRREEEQVHQVRIELGSPSFEERVASDIERLAFAVSTAVGDRVEGVGDGDDSCGEWDASSLETARVACAIPSLVMGEHTFGEIRIESVERGKHLGSACRMGVDGPSLGCGELSLVVDDVEQRLVDLSDVVEERDAFDALAFVLGEVGGLTQDEGIRRDAPDMSSSVGVIRVDRVEERLESGGREALGRLSRVLLVSKENGCRSCCGRTRAGEGGAGDSHAFGDGKSRSGVAREFTGVRIVGSLCASAIRAQIDEVECTNRRETKRPRRMEASGPFLGGAGDGLLSRVLSDGVPSAL
jgi:hypothetical protein